MKAAAVEGIGSWPLSIVAPEKASAFYTIMDGYAKWRLDSLIATDPVVRHDRE